MRREGAFRPLFMSGAEDVRGVGGESHMPCRRRWGRPDDAETHLQQMQVRIRPISPGEDDADRVSGRGRRAERGRQATHGGQERFSGDGGVRRGRRVIRHLATRLVPVPSEEMHGQGSRGPSSTAERLRGHVASSSAPPTIPPSGSSTPEGGHGRSSRRPSCKALPRGTSRGLPYRSPTTRPTRLGRSSL